MENRLGTHPKYGLGGDNRHIVLAFTDHTAEIKTIGRVAAMNEPQQAPAVFETDQAKTAVGISGDVAVSQSGKEDPPIDMCPRGS